MKKVVIIDDNAIVLESLCQCIDWAKMDFYVVATFSDGMDGLQYIMGNPVDLLILDINLPRVTGLEILKTIQQRKRTITSIAITGYDYFSYAREALLLGAVDIILKPIDNKVLYSIIQEKVLPANQNSNRQEKPQIQQENANDQDFSFCSTVPQIEYRNKIVRDAINYLSDTIKERHSLEETCAYLSVSKSHLCRVLRQECGKSFTEICTDIRIKKAVELLKTGMYRINEVAEKVGISNYAYFYQVFKKVTGQKPSDYVTKSCAYTEQLSIIEKNSD